jgi:hypothetical protein
MSQMLALFLLILTPNTELLTPNSGINHLGLIAGIIDEIGIEKIINDAVGIDEREIVTPGQIVKAIILNG